MRIDEGFQQQLWREPEDTDIFARHAPTPASEPTPQAAPEPEATLPFWAPGTPVPPNTLTALPPAEVAVPPSPPPPPPPPPAPAAYVGEASVDAAWLATRESALVAVRQDYDAARQQALASGGSGPGWQAAQLVTDESGQVSSPTGRTLVHVSDPNAQPVLVGYDEGGPVYQQPAGHWLEFNEEAFAAHYRAQGGAPLQQLAASYDTDAATLLARHPDIWSVATQAHALNAGPAPAGRAMGDAAQLGMLDLYMADPQVAALISSYGGSVAPPGSGLAHEQVRIYGQARYEQLTKLGNAMQSVRDQYSSAMAHARAHGGPGWTDRPRTVTVSDEGGATTTQPLYVTDESGQPLRGADGQPQALTERVFDPDAFTAWYVQQGGQQHQAFASFYGQSHTQYSTDESGQTFASSIGFDNPSWSMWGVGGGMSHKELRSLDLNHAPRLNNDGAVGFDLEAGWATHHSNIHQDRDWFESVVQVVIVAAVTYFSAGTLGPAVAGAAMGTTAAAATATVAGMAISGAVAGAAGALASGMVNGDVNFKDVLRGALAGGLTGGMLKAVGTAAGSTVGNVAIRATVQGGVQALLGGSFKDGAIAGLASGLAEAASAGMQTSISDAVKSGSMTPEQALTATRFARVVSSAIRVAGTDGDPGQAFASEFLGDLLQHSGLAEQALADIEASRPTGALGTGGQPGNPRGVPPAFDDEGNVMPGVVDPNAPREQQQAQLAAHLQTQGFSAEAAAQMSAAQFAPRFVGDPFATLSDTDNPTYRELLAEQLGIPVEQLQDAGFWDEAGRSAQVLRGFVEGLGFSVLGTGEAVLEVARSPGQFINGVKALLTSPEARAQFGAHVLDQVRTDLRLLEDAWNAGDLRGVGQQIGKLTGDLAQTAGGVEALVRLGVSSASVGGRLLLRGADALSDSVLQALRLSAPGLFDASGRPLMDFRALSSAQKGLVGELMGGEALQRLVPDAQRIGRVAGVGETGIDDLYRVSRPDVDYVVVEYKFGSSTLGTTRDGVQMSDSWLQGTATGYDRILESVNGNRVLADTVSDALRAGRVERWVVHTDPVGNVTVGIVDASGKFIPRPVSSVLGPKP